MESCGVFLSILCLRYVPLSPTSLVRLLKLDLFGFLYFILFPILRVLDIAEDEAKHNTGFVYLMFRPIVEGRSEEVGYVVLQWAKYK